MLSEFLSSKLIRRSLATLSVLAVLLLSLFARSAQPALGVAGENATSHISSVPLGFKVKASDGYVMYVLARRDLQSVDVSLSNEGSGRFSEAKGVIYWVQAEEGQAGSQVEVGSDYIRADFGRRGSIDVHFQPTGGSHGYRPACGGTGTLLQRGYYEGSISFRGENDFTHVSALRGQEDPELQLHSHCRAKEVADGLSSLPGAALIADSVRSGTPYFEAFKNSPTAPAYIGASINEGRGNLSITRYVEIVAPSSAFEYSPGLETAKVQPPAPFRGTGVYRAHRKGNRPWTGDLSVDLPGRASLPLTHRPLHGFINPAHWIMATSH